jgi:hypothetical protein
LENIAEKLMAEPVKFLSHAKHYAELSAKIGRAELNFFIYLYMSRNADKTEDALVQTRSRSPVQASLDMVIAANYCVYIFAKTF